LTVGVMTARQLVTSTGVVRVSGEGYAPLGGFLADDGECTPADDPLLYDVLRAGAACNDAVLGEQHGRPTVVGDPTEGALLVVAAKGGITRQDIETALPRLGTLPFDSERKRMTVIRQYQGQPWAFVKGAPEVILARCSRLRTSTGVETLTDSARAHMHEASALMANEALRVLALAERPLAQDPGAAHEPFHADDLELDLIDHGLEEMGESTGEKGEPILVARCAFADFGQLQKAIEERGLAPISTESEYIPTTPMTLAEAPATEVLQLIDRIEQDEDVQKVFHNLA